MNNDYIFVCTPQELVVENVSAWGRRFRKRKGELGKDRYLDGAAHEQ